MAHYDLYQSIGLDRSKDPATLGREIDQLMQSGTSTNAGGMEELWIARAVLGDPQRRSLYDRRLDDPNAPEVNVQALRELANANFGHASDDTAQRTGGSTKVETTRAMPREEKKQLRQHFPDTDPNMEPVQIQPTGYQPQPQPAYGGQPYYQQPPQQKQGNRWPWVILAIVLVAALAGAGWWAYTQYGGETKPWEGEEATIAQTFPEIVSEEDGGRGYQGLRCHSAEVKGEEQARVRCANSDTGISILQFGSEDARDATIPNTGEQRFGNDNCEIRSARLEGQNPPAFAVAPDGELKTYSILVNGNDAEQLRLKLPIC